MRQRFSKSPILKEDDTYDTLKTRIPKGIFLKLKRYSVEKKIPWARLIAYALRNEFDQEKPFTFVYVVPVITDENSSSDLGQEIDLIMKYMSKYTAGVGLDIMIVERETIGIPDHNRLILAYAHMIYMGLIYEGKASTRAYDYNPDMKVAKFTEITRVDYLKERPKNTRKGKEFLDKLKGTPLDDIKPSK